MPPSDLYLSETDIRSEGSKMFTVRSEAGDDRDWMLAAPIPKTPWPGRAGASAKPSFTSRGSAM